MPQPLYFRQIARRASGNLPILMPPRAPLMRAEAMSGLEMPEESLSNSLPVTQRLISAPAQETILPSVSSSAIVETETNNNPLISPVTLPSSTSLPQSNLDSTDRQVEVSSIQPIQAKNLIETSVSAKITPTSTKVEVLPGARENQLMSVVQGDKETPAKLRPNLQSEAADVTVAVEQVQPVPSDRLRPAKGDREASRREALLLSPDRYQTELTPKTTSRIPTLSTPSACVIDSPKGNNIHIGSIDIQITPPPTPPAKVVPKVSRPALTSALSRGFTSSFGLRQG